MFIVIEETFYATMNKAREAITQKPRLILASANIHLILAV
jgi:hypothetical protein